MIDCPECGYEFYRGGINETLAEYIVECKECIDDFKVVNLNIYYRKKVE